MKVSYEITIKYITENKSICDLFLLVKLTIFAFVIKYSAVHFKLNWVIFGSPCNSPRRDD